MTNKQRRELAKLILDDLADILFDEIIVLEVDNRLGYDQARENRITINHLRDRLENYQAILESTKRQLTSAIQASRDSEDRYIELKILYDAGVKQDVMKVG